MTSVQASPEAARKATEAYRSILDHPEVERFVRRAGLHKINGTLLLGDAIMVLTTHAASEKIPQENLALISIVACTCWVGTSLSKGDYNLVQYYPNDEWISSQPGYSVYVGIRESAFAWMVFVPVVLTALASLVIHEVVDAAPIVIAAEGCRVSPELEVIVAIALTVPCWRGFYFAKRDGMLP